MIARTLLLAALIAGSSLFLFGGGDPVSMADSAILVPALVQGIAFAVTLAFICVRSRVRRWLLFLVLFVVIYGVQVFMALNDLFFFDIGEAVGMTKEAITQWAIFGTIPSLVYAGAAVLLLAPTAPADWHGEPRSALSWTWRIAIISLSYVIFYLVAGYFVVAQSDAFKTFYEGQISVDPAMLLAVQIVRGAIWAILALLIVRTMAASRLTAGLAVGMTFAVFLSMQLLFPNDAFPDEIRLRHFVEILVSNFPFGLFAGFLLAPGRTPEATGD